MGIGNTTPAAVLIAAITGSEPVAVVGRGTGIDDQTWMRKTAAIRDALRRAKPVTADPVALLRTVAGADITAMAAFLAQAAVRTDPGGRWTASSPARRRWWPRSWRRARGPGGWPVTARPSPRTRWCWSSWTWSRCWR